METSLEVATTEGTRKRKRTNKGALVSRLTDSQKKRALEAASLGMAMEKIAILCGFPFGNDTQWHRYLETNKEFAKELRTAQVAGELDLQLRVRGAEAGWQGSAWLLERTRGYVARGAIEHSGRVSTQLTIAASVMEAIGEREKGA